MALSAGNLGPSTQEVGKGRRAKLAKPSRKTVPTPGRGRKMIVGFLCTKKRREGTTGGRLKARKDHGFKGKTHMGSRGQRENIRSNIYVTRDGLGRTNCTL